MMCNKISFSSKQEAKDYTRRGKCNNKSRAQFKVIPYKCDKCDSWHTTRYTKKIARVITKKIATGVIR